MEGHGAGLVVGEREDGVAFDAVDELDAEDFGGGEVRGYVYGEVGGRGGVVRFGFGGVLGLERG